MTQELREALLSAWRAALRRSVRTTAIDMQHPSFAGYLLRSHGSATNALEHCPSEPWFAPVRDMLERVAEEDAALAPATVIQLVQRKEEGTHAC